MDSIDIQLDEKYQEYEAQGREDLKRVLGLDLAGRCVFPRHCSKCQKEFTDSDEFLRRTLQCGNTKLYHRGLVTLRNCLEPCGTTLERDMHYGNFTQLDSIFGVSNELGRLALDNLRKAGDSATKLDYWKFLVQCFGDFDSRVGARDIDYGDITAKHVLELGVNILLNRYETDLTLNLGTS